MFLYLLAILNNTLMNILVKYFLVDNYFLRIHSYKHNYQIKGGACF